MNLIAFETYYSNALRGVNTSSNHLERLRTPFWEKKQVELIFELIDYLPLSALVPDVVLNWSAYLSLVEEGPVDELVQVCPL